MDVLVAFLLVALAWMIFKNLIAVAIVVFAAACIVYILRNRRNTRL